MSSGVWPGRLAVVRDTAEEGTADTDPATEPTLAAAAAAAATAAAAPLPPPCFPPLAFPVPSPPPPAPAEDGRLIASSCGQFGKLPSARERHLAATIVGYYLMLLVASKDTRWRLKGTQPIRA